MEAQCSSRDEAERRRRSKLRAEDEKMHSLAQQGRQSLIIVSDPLAPSDYTGRKLSPGVSSGGFSDGSSSPACTVGLCRRTSTEPGPSSTMEDARWRTFPASIFCDTRWFAACRA